MTRQTDRTRAAISATFQELVFTRRYEDIRMSDIARAANIGRSTLYTHYRERDDILVETMLPVLRGLALAIDGGLRHADISSVLEHFWSHRDRARMLLYGTPGTRLELALSGVIQASLEGRACALTLPASVIGAEISAAMLAVLRLWLRGEAGIGSADLAAHLTASAAALVAAASRPAA